MTNKHISHIRKTGEIQTNKEHLEDVRKAAAIFGAKAGLKNFLTLAAILHDMGKETQLFQEYLENAVSNDDHTERGKVDHATAGAFYIFHQYHHGGRNERLTAEMLAMIIAYHHGGLSDFVNMECRSEFMDRMEKSADIFSFEEAKSNYFQACFTEKEVEELFQSAVFEIKSIREQIEEIGLPEELNIALLTKFAYSCLIDADRLDTYCFMQSESLSQVLGNRIDWNPLSQKLEKKLASFKMKAGAGDEEKQVYELRRRVADQCLSFAKEPNGIYRLTVPTGGGKTYSAFRYALAHSNLFHGEHIYYFAPFLTILDQNVKDMRDALDLASMDQDTLLEYHSNVLQGEKTEWEQLMAERFEASIVFTTLVQFLNSFYEKGTRSIRRLHQFANSVLIFDEAQAVPYHCIHLFNAALNFLVELCGATVILCTATQPELEQTAKPIRSRNSGEMIGDVRGLFAQLKRTQVADRRKPKGYTIDELSDFVWEKAKLEGNALVILNKKKQVESLYQKIKEENEALDVDSQFEVYHLSTHMCPQHRLDILEKLEDCLQDHKKVICISTQLIEAGVNISFRCVVRGLAGMDSIAQAAGRCNRHGEAGMTKTVYLVNIADEDLSKLREIDWGRDQTISVLNYFSDDEESFDGSLLSPKAIETYFNCYYNRDKQLMDYPVKNALSNVTVMSLLSKNLVCVENYNENNAVPLDLECSHGHKTAAETFEVIPGGTIAVVTDYKKGAEIIADLNGMRDLEKMKLCLKQAQRYSVNLYQWEFDELCRNKGIVALWDGAVYALAEGFYSDETGILLGGGAMDFCGF